MTDFQFLLLALTVIYLSECLLWVKRGSLVFRRWFSGFSPANPSPGIGARHTGIVIVNPLPPFGEAFVSHAWPLSFWGGNGDAATPAGVCAGTSQTINGSDRPEYTFAFIPFSDIYKVGRDDDQLQINGRKFAACNSERLARCMEALLKELLLTPAAERPAAIHAVVRHSFSTHRIRRQLQRLRFFSGSLRLNAHMLLLVIFGAIPLTIGNLMLRQYLLPSLVMLAGLMLIQGFTFFYAHRRLFPEAVGARWRGTITMTLTPTATIRACDLLSKELLARFHPLAVAAVLCPEKQRRAITRTVLLDLRTPMEPACFSDDPRARQAVAGFHELLSQTAREFLHERGEDVDALIAPPARMDPSCRTFCPRCENQYVIAEGTCHHCGGVPLRAFSELPLV